MKDIIEILPDVGHTRQSVLPVRNAEHAGYAQYMAEAFKDQREETRKLQEIMAKRAGVDLKTFLTQQSASTQAILARPKEKDLEHWMRPLPDCQVKDEDGNVDVAERELSIKEIMLEETKRRAPKNSTGQSEKPSAGEERREAAVNAFVHSPGIPLSNLSSEERARIQKPEPYPYPPILAIQPEKPKPKDKTFWTHGLFLELKNWFKR